MARLEVFNNCPLDQPVLWLYGALPPLLAFCGPLCFWIWRLNAKPRQTSSIQDLQCGSWERTHLGPWSCEMDAAGLDVSNRLPFSIHWLSIYLSTYLPIYLCIMQALQLLPRANVLGCWGKPSEKIWEAPAKNLSIYPSIHLSIHPSMDRSIYLSIFLCVRVSIS